MLMLLLERLCLLRKRLQRKRTCLPWKIFPKADDFVQTGGVATFEELIEDDGVTLWGLLLENRHLIDEELTRDLEEALEYPAGWLEVLLRIARTPGDGVPMTQLARMVLFSSGGFTKLADRMEAAGLIRRI